MELFSRIWSLMLALWCISSAALAQAGIVDQVAAIVNDEIVTLSDIEWAIAVNSIPVPASAKEKRDLYLRTLDKIIEEKLVQQETDRTPITVISEEEVERQHRELDKKFGGREEHDAFLRRVGIDEAEMHQIIRRQIGTLHFVENRFRPFVIILQDELQKYYEDIWVPRFRKEGIDPPPLSQVEDRVRENLIEQKIDEELEKWIQSSRKKADIVILLYRKNPNLPPEVQQ